ncbi:hypothetical protein HGH93_13760 [Chitinophaga polysaccharea]|uniref:hypothetical protein n=1 Tax=Chitinophaga TaxID=79328 RepID=UPI001455990D|nr:MULTISPECIES: hypothetical protein [Chitinophaga]NLR59176.1 hypothetical protein [Chitinophaga polysaccharea]NLU92055.1 hypothetical protein [Chitinophaga sp. Ak27]
MEQEKPSEKKIKWTNPHRDGDYEYVNSSSKSPWPASIMFTAFGLGSIYLGWRRYNELLEWQTSGTTIRMRSLEKLCYDLAGIWLFPLILGLFGLFMLLAAIANFRRNQKLKKS